MEEKDLATGKRNQIIEQELDNPNDGLFPKELVNQYNKVLDISQRYLDGNFCNFGSPYFFSYSMGDFGNLIVNIKDSRIMYSGNFSGLAEDLSERLRESGLEYRVFEKK